MEIRFLGKEAGSPPPGHSEGCESNGAQLAERLRAQIRAWDRDRTAQPVLTAYPAGTPDQDLAAGVVIDKRFVRLVVSG